LAGFIPKIQNDEDIVNVINAFFGFYPLNQGMDMSLLKNSNHWLVVNWSRA